MGNNEFGHGVSWCKRNAVQNSKNSNKHQKTGRLPQNNRNEQLMLKDRGRKILKVHRYIIIREGGKVYCQTEPRKNTGDLTKLINVQKCMKRENENRKTN